MAATTRIPYFNEQAVKVETEWPLDSTGRSTKSIGLEHHNE
jgi:hypothetical protein